MKLKLSYLSMILILIAGGCSSMQPKRYQSKKQFLDYLMAGYDKTVPNVYWDDWRAKQSRLKDLLRGLGYEDYTYSCQSVNKGECLMFMKFNFSSDPNQAGVLVLTNDGPPRQIRYPEPIPFRPNRIVINEKKDGKRRYVFPNGYNVDPNDANAVWDEQQRYFCYGEEKSGYDTRQNKKDKPTIIIPVEEPENAVLSQLKRCPDKIIATRDKLYLVAVTYGSHKTLPDLHFEVFQIIEDALVYEKDFYLNIPWRFAKGGYWFGDFDYQTNSLIIFAMRDWPYPSVRYVYDIDDDRLKKITQAGEPRFIRPDILENAIQFISLDNFRSAR